MRRKSPFKIFPTVSSHQRGILAEVMGRDCGYFALMAGIAGGAEVIIIPEIDTDPDVVARQLLSVYREDGNKE